MNAKLYDLYLFSVRLLLLDHSQQKVVQLSLFVYVQEQVSVVEGYAAPNQVAVGDLLVFLVECALVYAPQYFQHRN